MAEWRVFHKDTDYKHKSRAVTAYKAGQTVYLPSHIANDKRVQANSEPTEKPDKRATDEGEGDGRRVYLTDEDEAFARQHWKGPRG